MKNAKPLPYIGKIKGTPKIKGIQKIWLPFDNIAM
jgi:hypothetical protein